MRSLQATRLSHRNHDCNIQSMLLCTCQTLPREYLGQQPAAASHRISPLPCTDSGLGSSTAQARLAGCQVPISLVHHLSVLVTDQHHQHHQLLSSIPSVPVISTITGRATLHLTTTTYTNNQHSVKNVYTGCWKQCPWSIGCPWIIQASQHCQLALLLTQPSPQTTPPPLAACQW